VICPACKEYVMAWWRIAGLVPVLGAPSATTVAACGPFETEVEARSALSVPGFYVEEADDCEQAMRRACQQAGVNFDPSPLYRVRAPDMRRGTAEATSDSR
jgi:hypothetical protein